MMTNNKQRIIVGMSGGVDSAVAALLLKQQGYDVLGVFMKNWDEEDENGVCAADEDYTYVRQVCAHIDIPFYSINFVKEYEERVFSYFIDEYKKGRTPNPDVMCNKEIKFKAFLDFALKLDAQFLATGHYARVQEKDGKHYLLRGKDNNKDQSYFLYTLGQAQLSKVMFPVGNIDKPEVRKIAREANLPNADRKDSTGICFIGERDFKKFLLNYIPAQPGDMVDVTTGKKVGTHDGLMFHTLGQRKGLGIGGQKTGIDLPWFVVGKDLENNILLVAQGEHPMLYSRQCTLTDLSWVQEAPLGDAFNCAVKTRYRQKDIECSVKIQNNIATVTFHEDTRAVTPGQHAVFYDGEICLGGGIIDTVKR
ncbi:MAG: tRNA 2-thiouridine(34) synthase MnmA [Clostridiales bacterium]|nr:tRNA 2-thiouridine(34) synthase MnmA [Clostridiales bacterium]